MAASIQRIWRMVASATVIAGLKCAPQITASVWISMKRTKTCTKPITDQSMNGWTGGSPGPCGVGGVMNRLITMVMKNTSAAVPSTSATNAAGPRSGMTSTGSAGGPAAPVVTPGSDTATSPPRVDCAESAGQSNQTPGQYPARVLRRVLPILLLSLAAGTAGCGGGSGN